jgi:hypothetical protein
MNRMKLNGMNLFFVFLVMTLFPLNTFAQSASEAPKAQEKPGPHRSGFTLELGIGFAITHIFPSVGGNFTKIGMAPLSLSLGGFVNNDLAIMFRMAGASYFRENAFGDLQDVALGFYGVHVQYWFNDWYFISGGPGLALYGAVFGRTSLDPRIKPGFGFNVRTGFSFASWKHHSLRFSLELFPSFFSKVKAMAETIIFEWQWF